MNSILFLLTKLHNSDYVKAMAQKKVRQLPDYWLIFHSFSSSWIRVRDGQNRDSNQQQVEKFVSCRQLDLV
jgi:hypothetical protein